MARTRYIVEPGTGRLVPVEDYRRPEPTAPTVQIDAYARNPTVSPVDGRLLSSRADLREHNRALGVQDIGSDPAGRRPYTPPWDKSETTRAVRDALRRHGL